MPSKPPLPPPEASNVPILHEPPPPTTIPPLTTGVEAHLPDDEHLLTEIEKQMLGWWLEIDEKGLFVHPPKDDDELHEFIQIAYEVTIPRKVVEPGHRAPFDFIADLYFERVRNALAFANRSGGKALALNTPILTSRGWSTMGELAVGDLVFAPDGTPTRVYTTSAVQVGHPCFRVVFNAGQEFIADGEHLWVVTRAKETQKQVLSTHEIHQRLQNPPRIGYKTLFFIDRPEPIQFPAQTFVVPLLLRHGIKSIVRATSVPVRCIGVEHPSRLFLAGKHLIPTHNTFSVAIINHLDMLFKPGCEIASAGAVRDQAKKAYNYFTTFCEFEWFTDLCERYKRKTRKTFIVKQIQEETKFATGSEQTIITATEKGLRSPHPHKARLDEIDLIDWPILQTGLSMARSTKKIKGQNVFTSTRQLAKGSMQRLLDEAPAKGIEVYEWNIWETVERCSRHCFDDPEHGTCSIYTFCKGKAHTCDGFIPVEDFVDKVRLIDRERFEVEWLNQRPARDKLVYGMFDNTRHVMTPEKLFTMTGSHYPHVLWQRISGLDFGAGPGHPFVYLKLCQIPNTGAWLIFFEYVAEQRLMADHAAAIKGSPYWSPNEWIFSDWAAQERIELLHHRIRCRPAQKDVLMGIDYVSSLLRGFPPSEVPMLYVWHECTFVISEFGLYRWPTDPDGRINRSGKPLKVNDHAMDGGRYALFSFKHKPERKYRMSRVRGI